MRLLLSFAGLIAMTVVASAAQQASTSFASPCSLDRMPVYRPELSRIERMPVMRPDTLKLERMPIVRTFFCATERRLAPADTDFGVWPLKPLPRR